MLTIMPPMLLVLNNTDRKQHASAKGIHLHIYIPSIIKNVIKIINQVNTV